MRWMRMDGIWFRYSKWKRREREYVVLINSIRDLLEVWWNVYLYNKSLGFDIGVVNGRLVDVVCLFCVVFFCNF